MPGKDFNTGAKRARECRAALGLEPDGPVGCLLTTVEDAGVHVVLGRLRDGVAGAYQRRGPFHLVFVDAASSRGRQRFTLAHELGHVRMAHGTAAIDTLTTLSAPGYDPHEVQANAFAGELLAPKATLEREARAEPDLEEVVRLADRFGLSAPAMLVRLSVAGKLSSPRERRLKEELGENLHRELERQLGLDGPDDGLARAVELPYVSPSLDRTALGDLLRGRATLEEAARIAGVDPAALRPAVELLAAPPPPAA